MTSTLPQLTYFCRQCQVRKEARAFEWTTAMGRDGVPYPTARKICRVCCGEEGHKPCRTCEGDKPIGEFYWVKSGGSEIRRPMPDCKECWREAKNLRQRGHRKPLRGSRGPKPGATYNGVRPPGWTPPPSAEQLAAIHNSYRPWPGFERPAGEQCA